VPARRSWIILCVGAALFVEGPALASCGGDDEGAGIETAETATTTQTQTQTQTSTQTTTTPPVEKPTVVRIRVVGGVPKGEIVRKTVQKGDRVVVIVTSDVADEVHLHGYDLSRDVAAGGTARIRFKANVPGRFEIELESRGVQIADLTVEQ
jgi:hypothetical protein